MWRAAIVHREFKCLKYRVGLCLLGAGAFPRHKNNLADPINSACYDGTDAGIIPAATTRVDCH